MNLPPATEIGPYGKPVPRTLLGYTVWAVPDGYHARWNGSVPWLSGCHQEITAPTWLELTQEAVRNRVTIWKWQLT